MSTITLAPGFSLRASATASATEGNGVMFAFLRSSGSRSVTAHMEAQVAISAILAAL